MSDMSKLISEFVWFDMMTTDLEKSVAFYKELFPEWNIEAQEVAPGFTYHMIHVAGRKTGGFVGMEEGGPPSHWISYVSVEDCDKAIEEAEALGAKTLVPGFTAPGVGRMAVMGDPQGAYFKPMALENAVTPKNTGVGDFVWMELSTNDLDGAEAFYKKLFGWESERVPMGEDLIYVLLKKGDMEVAGAMTAEEGVPPMWVPYIECGDVDARFAKALELGATQMVPPMDIPGDIGRFAYITDPSGAVVALYKDAKS